MKFRTSKKEVWITSDGQIIDSAADADPEEAAFLVTVFTPKDITENIEKCTRKEWDRGQRFEQTNWYKAKIRRICRSIKDWVKVEDEDGNALECNSANKETVYLFNSDVIDRVLDAADVRGIQVEQEKEEEEGN